MKIPRRRFRAPRSNVTKPAMIYSSLPAHEAEGCFASRLLDPADAYGSMFGARAELSLG
jgi:hypothetical protein